MEHRSHNVWSHLDRPIYVCSSRALSLLQQQQVKHQVCCQQDRTPSAAKTKHHTNYTTPSLHRSRTSGRFGETGIDEQQMEMSGGRVLQSARRTIRLSPSGNQQEKSDFRPCDGIDFTCRSGRQRKQCRCTSSLWIFFSRIRRLTVNDVSPVQVGSEGGGDQTVDRHVCARSHRESCGGRY